MSKSRAAPRRFAALLCLAILCVASKAEAGEERAEILSHPSPPPKASSPKPATPPAGQAKKRPAMTQAEKKRKARLTCISDLFLRYNKKLSREGAMKYAEYIVQAGEKFGQDPFVIAAMIVNESSARHDAVSRGGDYGLMQVRWRVHRKDITKKYPHIREASDMLNPKDNVLVGTEIFSRYRASAPDLRGGLLRYSAGNKKLARKIFAVLEGLESSYHKYLQTVS